MNRIRRIRRLTAVLAGLACAWLGLAVAAPAAFAATRRFRLLVADHQARLCCVRRWPRTSTSWRRRPQARPPCTPSSSAACPAGRSP